MQAKDIMVSPVITAKPYFTVQHVAKIMAQHHVSALPVVDEDLRLVGIVSEGDLVHRYELGTERPSSWWLTLFGTDDALARDYIKVRTKKITDLMTKNVITASPETPLDEIAMLIERNGVKRIPIVVNDELVGLVSRANLIQALAAHKRHLEVQPTDQKLRSDLLNHLKKQNWSHTDLLNVTVSDGVVDLWGYVPSDVERKAVRVAAESFAGIRAVNDHLYSSRHQPVVA